MLDVFENLGQGTQHYIPTQKCILFLCLPPAYEQLNITLEQLKRKKKKTINCEMKILINGKTKSDTQQSEIMVLHERPTVVLV